MGEYIYIVIRGGGNAMELNNALEDSQKRTGYSRMRKYVPRVLDRVNFELGGHKPVELEQREGLDVAQSLMQALGCTRIRMTC